MAPPRLNKVCSVEGCERKHAAHGLCLMHYKRLKRHGSPDYRWGGAIIGRACAYCERPAVAREMCFRHYQMWRKHGDPLYSDRNGPDELRRGYRLEPATRARGHVAAPNDPSTTKTDQPYRRGIEPLGLRDGSKRTGRRRWVHRKIAGAKPGQIVHHIDGDKLNNAPENLHIFENAKQHGAAHRSLELIAYDLLRLGIVEFHPFAGAYRLAEAFLQSIGDKEQQSNFQDSDNAVHLDTVRLGVLSTVSS